MPIYEYACEKCNTKFEKLVRTMSDDHKIPCPSCGSTKTSRQLSTFAVASESPTRSAPPGPCGHQCGGDGPCPFK